LSISSPAAAEAIRADVVIIGAGPCGLFQAFELGLLGISAHIVDSLAHPGGQCAELYPDKPIYDIPALPVCNAQELVDRLMQQIKPFAPQFHLGQEVSEFAKLESGRFQIPHLDRYDLRCGRGRHRRGTRSFQPRRIGLEGAQAFEDEHIHYRVRRATDLHGQQLVIFGGGDSAARLDLGARRKGAGAHPRASARGFFAPYPPQSRACANSHRRGASATLRRCRTRLIIEDGRLAGVNVKATDGQVHPLRADKLLVSSGCIRKLGPIAEWGLALEKKALLVDTQKFETSLPGVFAVGDINFLSGQEEADSLGLS